MPTLSWEPLHLTEQVLDGYRSITDICQRAGGWNISGIELYDGLLTPIGQHDPAEVRQMLDECGIAVSLLVCATDFASPSAAVRQEQRDMAERYLDVAAELGSPAVRFTAGEMHPGITRPDAMALAVENLVPLAATATERGMVCCIENMIRDHRWHAADITAPAAAFRDFLPRLEGSNVKVLLNTGNPLLMMSNVLTVLEAIPQDMLWGVHLSERLEMDGSHACLGEGPVPWDALREALIARGFKGYFSVVDGQTDGDPGTLQSLQFAREWIADLETAAAAGTEPEA